jgi:hypothetical protein
MGTVLSRFKLFGLWLDVELRDMAPVDMKIL